MITDNYIKMCGRAEEIQKECKYVVGDHFSWISNQEIFIYHKGIRGKLSKDFIWLPTQGQLQEMIHKTDWHGVLLAFHLWYQEFDFEEITSMNELWLAFVIHEKYHKIWTGEKWVRKHSGK